MGLTSMDPTDDELQLKAHVTSTLTERGVLGKIKAQLRAAVFDVMHEQGEYKRNPNAAQLEDFALEESSMAMEIIMEFLAFFQFEHALRVLQTEANRTAPEADRFAASVRAKLGLATGGKSQAPVLLQMLERLLQREDEHSPRPDSVKIDSVRANKTVSPVAAESHHGGNGNEMALPNAGERWQDKDDNWKPSGRRQELVAPPYLASEEHQAHRVPAASDHMEESTAEEEILSGSEIDESVAEEEQSASVNYSQDYSTSDFALPEKDPVAVEAQEQTADKDRNEESKSEASDEEEDESAKRPPPVPSKLLPAFEATQEKEPMLPPVTSTTVGANFDDEDSDSDAEAARLNALDAKLKAMEAEDESGVLQQLKASLQAELQQQDDHESSKTGEEHDPYGSDFEEEEVVSEISEEVESVVDLSDQENESGRHDGTAISQLAVPPSVVLTDKAVEGKDALNSYDYIEDVERN